jgi:hypothetical protein
LDPDTTPNADPTPDAEPGANADATPSAQAAPSADTTPSSAPARSPLPSVGDIIFACLMWLLLGVLPNFVYGDGSTGWHLVTGHYILDNFQIPRTDLMSHTFADKAWVPYEWLSDVIFAGLERIGGLELLAIAIAGSISFLFVAIYDQMRTHRCNFGLTLVLTIIGILASSIHWLARPHIFTFFGVYIFTRYLEAFHRGEISARTLYIILGLTMLIWVNAHPAFLIGFAVLMIYSLCDFAATLLKGPGDAQQTSKTNSIAMLVSLAITGVAACLTPYGLALFSYISKYLKQSSILSQTDEYLSPVFHGQLHATCLELLFFALAFGLATSRWKPKLAQLLTVLAFAHLSLSAVRNEPLFVIVALPLIGQLYGNNGMIEQLGVAQNEMASWFAFIRRKWNETAASFDETELSCTMHLLPIAVMVVLSGSAILHKINPEIPSIIKSGFDAKTKPTTTLAYLKDHNLDFKRGFNYDNWGGYLRYKTGERVYIDDRADFYGEDFYLKYAEIAQLKPTWRDLLEKQDIRWVLFPPNSHLAENLKNTPGWKLAAQDQASVLFVRE